MLVRLRRELPRDHGDEVIQVVVEEAEPGLQEYPVEALGEQVKEHRGCPESEREDGFVIEVPLPLEA